MRTTIRWLERRRRWEVDVREGKFRRRVTTRTQKEAERLAEAIQRNVLRAEARQGRPHTVAELLIRHQIYLEESGRTAATVANYENAGRYAGAIIGRLAPEDVGRQHYHDLLVALRASGLGSASVDTYLRRVTAAFRHAVRMGWLVAYPWSEMQRPTVPRRPKDWLRPVEWPQVSEALEPQWRFDVLWLMCTGCRIAEAGRVTWSDVDLARGTVTIREAKGGDGRVAPILPPWRPDVQAEYLRQGRPNDGRVMVHNLHWVRLKLREASRRAMRRTIRPHDLRRTYAIWARDAGVPIHLVARALGHTSIRTTERWYLECDAHQVVDAFQEAFGRTPGVFRCAVREMREKERER